MHLWCTILREFRVSLTIKGWSFSQYNQEFVTCLIAIYSRAVFCSFFNWRLNSFGLSNIHNLVFFFCVKIWNWRPKWFALLTNLYLGGIYLCCFGFICDKFCVFWEIWYVRCGHIVIGGNATGDSFLGYYQLCQCHDCVLSAHS